MATLSYSNESGADDIATAADEANTAATSMLSAEQDALERQVAVQTAKANLAIQTARANACAVDPKSEECTGD